MSSNSQSKLDVNTQDESNITSTHSFSSQNIGSNELQENAQLCDKCMMLPEDVKSLWLLQKVKNNTIYNSAPKGYAKCLTCPAYFVVQVNSQ